MKIADGVPEVMKAVRENFRSGATQIKIMGSGSVSGAHDPLDVGVGDNASVMRRF